MECSQHPRQFLNSFLASRAFKAGDAIARHAPVEVHLQLSSTCNLDCLMCVEHLHAPAARRTRELEFLPAKIFDELEGQVLSSTSRLMLGVGGEPLLCPELFDYAERAQRLGVDVEVLTNGTRIRSGDTPEKLARLFRFINLSIDGATRETYERIRRGASFDGVLEGLELLNRHRLARPAEERPKLRFCAVLMRDNIHELPELVRLAHRHSVDRVCAAHVVPLTPEGHAQSLVDDQELSDHFLLEACAVADELGVEVDLPQPFSCEAAARVEARAPADSRAEALQKKQEMDQEDTSVSGAPRLHCHMPTMSLYVLVDGRVFPCAHPLVQQREPLGNLGTQGFAEIWNGRAFRNLRAGLAAGDPPPVCRTCCLMHSPPPPPEVQQDIGGDLLSHFAGRDLFPIDSPPSATWALDSPTQALLGETLRQLLEVPVQLGEEIRQQEAHATTLHRDLEDQRSIRELLLQELAELRTHTTALERENEQLAGHVGNLERILSRIHGRRIYGALCRVKDFFARGTAK